MADIHVVLFKPYILVNKQMKNTNCPEIQGEDYPHPKKSDYKIHQKLDCMDMDFVEEQLAHILSVSIAPTMSIFPVIPVSGFL